jgi:predicted O-methyltransferase YrrM
MRTVPGNHDLALTSPAAERNRGPILDVLRRVIGHGAHVVEIASGTGEHAAWFCKALPHVLWQPTDRDPAALRSIAAWRERAGLANLLPPLMLDAASPDAWPVARADVVVAINMIHISPWAATIGLMQGASAILPEGGLLVAYGAFREAGVTLADSNLAFDADLRARDPQWGLREFGAVCDEAHRAGLVLRERIEMPARNLALLFRRASPASCAVVRS